MAVQHINDTERLVQFVQFFTDRFYGHPFGNERQIRNCIADFQRKRELEGHYDMWPEVKNDEQPKPDSQRSDQ